MYTVKIYRGNKLTNTISNRCFSVLLLDVKQALSQGYGLVVLQGNTLVLTVHEPENREE